MSDAVLDLGRKKQRRTLDRVGGISTVLGASTRFVGDFSGAENYVIYGTVEGNCELEGTLVLEENAHFKGNMKANNIIVAGEVIGDVVAQEKLELASTAKISGNISGRTVAIAQGAVVQGAIRMTTPGTPVHYVERRTDRPIP